MGTETCQIRGQGSQSSRYWIKKTTGWTCMVQGETDKKANDIQTWLSVGRNLERYVRSVEAKRKAEAGYRKTEGWQYWKIAWYLPHWSSRWRIQGDYGKCTLKVGSSDASSNALQNQTRRVQRNLQRFWIIVRQNTHRWSRRIYEEAHGRISLQVSWRSCCRERNEIIQPLQSCAQIYFYASSNAHISCKKQQRTKNGKNSRKYQHGSWRKSETIRRWSLKQGMRSKPCTLRRWWTSVISRMRSWNRNCRNTKGRVVLRGDIVKDDSGSHAVFTEQSSSATQMTAAKVMDVIARLPGCAGQAADATPAYTQVKMEDAPTLLNISKVRVPR